VDKPIWSIIVVNFQDHQTTEIIEESVLLKQGTIVEHYFAHSKVIRELTLSSGLHPLFHPLSPLSVASQSMEILLNLYEMLKLRISCTRFESFYTSCIGTSSENICSSSGRDQENEREDETQFTTKIGGKLVWVPVISFCEIFILSYTFDALLCWN
jgi:hypothetical protein